jgi:hypothetical protein
MILLALITYIGICVFGFFGIHKTCVLAQNYEVDESLGSYWQCIPSIDQKSWYTNEVYNRKKLKIQLLDKYAFKSLKNTKMGKKLMKG